MDYQAQSIGGVIVIPAFVVVSDTYLAFGLLAAYWLDLRPGSARWAACVIGWPLLLILLPLRALWRAIGGAVYDSTLMDSYDY